MPDTYDHITLMCRLKAAQRRNKELESGERYIQLEELHQKEYNVYEHKIEKLKKELADAYKETIRVRNYWFQVLEDMLREFEKAQKRSAQELRKMEIRALFRSYSICSFFTNVCLICSSPLANCAISSVP